jgi:hypothetical protein
MPVTLRSNKSFVTEMRRRLSSLQGNPIQSTLRVPDELSWWAAFEFGTTDYEIRSLNGRALRFPIDGVFKFATEVHFPGRRPQLIYRSERQDILNNALDAIADYFRLYGVRRSTLNACLKEDIMPYAKAAMVQRIAEVAPGTREDGKLHGESAADAWEEEAEIVKS